MCGITGVIVAKGTPAVAVLYEALLALQHRGQDAAGIVTEDAGRLCLRKENGMVRDVFQQDHIANLTGDMGIGHVRYPTAGSSCSSEAQPFYVNSPFGITLAHNGNLINTAQLKSELQREWRHINTGSDSEVLLNILAGALLEALSGRSRGSSDETAEMEVADGVPTPVTDIVGAEGATGPTLDDLLHAARTCISRCIGGYAVVAMVTGYGILAFRDPHGIRPLVYGKRRIGAGEPGAAGEGQYEWMVASESGALSALGYDTIADVPAGHALVLRRDSSASPILHDCLPASISPRPALAPCLFEYVYFARPDSVLDGISVYRTRLRMGDKLARKIMKQWPDYDIDVVIPVPDTSRTSALECAATLGIKYREGFIKNRYIGRTFIMPQQGLRRKSVRQKLAPISSEFVGRNVLLVDDSIVRGTTSREIILMAREAGAKRVYMASAAPPVRYPNVYGIDMPTRAELVANGGDESAPTETQLEEEVARAINADRVIYQGLDDLKRSVIDEAEAVGSSLRTLDCSCFDGNYVTSLDADYLAVLAATRTSGRGNRPPSATHLLDRLEIPKKARAR